VDAQLTVQIEHLPQPVYPPVPCSLSPTKSVFVHCHGLIYVLWASLVISYVFGLMFLVSYAVCLAFGSFSHSVEIKAWKIQSYCGSVGKAGFLPLLFGN
jgi:hypothetical protein